MTYSTYKKTLAGGWNKGVDRADFMDDKRKSVFRSEARQELKEKKRAYNHSGEVV